MKKYYLYIYYDVDGTPVYVLHTTDDVAAAQIKIILALLDAAILLGDD